MLKIYFIFICCTVSNLINLQAKDGFTEYIEQNELTAIADYFLNIESDQTDFESGEKARLSSLSLLLRHPFMSYDLKKRLFFNFRKDFHIGMDPIKDLWGLGIYSEYGQSEGLTYINQRIIDQSWTAINKLFLEIDIKDLSESKKWFPLILNYRKIQKYLVLDRHWSRDNPDLYRRIKQQIRSIESMVEKGIKGKENLGKSEIFGFLFLRSIGYRSRDRSNSIQKRALLSLNPEGKKEDLMLFNLLCTDDIVKHTSPKTPLEVEVEHKKYSKGQAFSDASPIEIVLYNMLFSLTRVLLIVRDVE